MINPVLTAIFDLFLIGSASSIVAAMALEYRSSKGPAIGRVQSAYKVRMTTNSAMPTRRVRRSRLRAA